MLNLKGQGKELLAERLDIYNFLQRRSYKLYNTHGLSEYITLTSTLSTLHYIANQLEEEKLLNIY